jgi:O-antigen ligase
VMLRERLQGDRYSDSVGDSRFSGAQKKVAKTSAALTINQGPSVGLGGGQARWNLAFLGLIFYAFIEYSRLPEMYPVLQPLQLGKVAVVLAAVGYLVSFRVRASGPSNSKGLDLAVLVFVFGNFLSACFTSQQDQVWNGFLDVLLWGVVYFLMTRILVSSWRVRVFLFLLFLLNLKLAQHTVREYFLGRSLGISDMQIIMSGGAGEGTSSFFGNVADLGLAMAVVWGIVWALLLVKAEKKKLARIFLIICFIVFLLAILLCGSRGAVAGAGAIALVALARSPKKIGAVLLALIFVAGAWFVLPAASKERFRNAWVGNDANASSRIMFWRIGLRMFEQNPILGVGPGNFAAVNPTHYVSHSLYIQVLAESGLAGTVPLAVILILFFRLNARTRKRALTSRSSGRRSFEYCMAFGLDLALVGYLTSGAFLSVLYYPHLWILLGLSVAVNRCSTNTESEEQAIEKRSRNLALATS